MEIIDVTATTAVVKWKPDYTGDGPIVSFTPVIRLSEGELPWDHKMIINTSLPDGKSEYNTNFKNLKPFTNYSVAVRVSREGPSGLGPASGLAMFVTNCSGKAHSYQKWSSHQ